MADIQLRFNRDVLVLSGPVERELERAGLDVARDGAFTLLVEPEVYDGLYDLEAAAGAQCLVAPTADLVPSRLAHSGLQEQAEVLAKTAVGMLDRLNPQHVLVELGPCGLPLDVASKASLNENRDQYARAARLFDSIPFDAFFLNRFGRVADLRCALMGIRKVSDAPIFASVDVDAQGYLASGLDALEDAIVVMAEYGAQVAGIATTAPLTDVLQLVERMRAVVYLPLLIQLVVAHRDPEQEAPTDTNPYFEADTMVDAADALRGAGVQFLRAMGDATPAYTGALVAATDRLDVVCDQNDACAPAADEPIEDVAERLRQRIANALGQQSKE